MPIKSQPFSLLVTIFLIGCSTTVIDEYRENPSTSMLEGESIVVLGRRNNSSYETEFDFIKCVGRSLDNSLRGINIIPEQLFLDNMYPYFETSKAPMDVQNLAALVTIPEVAQKLYDYRLRYFIWIDGFTETTERTGGLSCAAIPTAAACFGYASWDDEATYEAIIWDFKDVNLAGKISAQSSGTSYLPAVIVPIPLLAQVQSNACNKMGSQIKAFLK